MKKIILCLLMIVNFCFSQNNFTQNFNSEENLKKEEFSKDEKLNLLKLELQKEILKNENFKKEIKQNEEKLSLLEEEFKEKSGDLLDLNKRIKILSLKIIKDMSNSNQVLSQDYKFQFFKKISSLKSLSFDDIREFFLALNDKISEDSNILKLQANIIDQKGNLSTKEVFVLANFTAFSEGKYLKPTPNLNAFKFISKEPNFFDKGDINDLKNKKIISLLIDIDGRNSFNSLELKLSLINKIKQGGIIGYIIISLGILGLIFGFFKIIILELFYKNIKKQMKNIHVILKNNPLGKIIKIFHENKNINELEININKELIKEINKIEYGKNFIKLLASITPLLGLLGTVTGMITSFEAITIFGTNDPKFMAEGISSALVTTVLGLIFAIPLLFIYSFVNSKSSKIIAILEDQSIGFIAKGFKNE